MDSYILCISSLDFDYSSSDEEVVKETKDFAIEVDVSYNQKLKERKKRRKRRTKKNNH